VIFSSGGSLDDFFMEAYSACAMNYPKYYKMDNLSKAGVLAAEVLLKDAAVLAPANGSEVGVVLSNRYSSLDTDQRYFDSTRSMASPALFVYTLPNIVAGEICIRHKLKGENAFFVSSQFDAQLLAQYTALVMHEGAGTKRCIAGWVDVLHEHHDVFLYLIEKNASFSVEQLIAETQALYNSQLWNN
jgi:hypothetical protein